MPQGPDSEPDVGDVQIRFGVLADGAITDLRAQGVPVWWQSGNEAGVSLEALLGLPANAALIAALGQTRKTRATISGVEAICSPGIGPRLLRYVVRSDARAVRVELSADARLAALEDLLATLHKASHDLQTTTATVLASASMLADATQSDPTTLRNRDRIERAIHAALKADAENLTKARAKLAALGAQIAV